MPFKSDSQRRFMYATNPAMAAKFAAETRKGTNLPDKVSARKKAIMAKAKAGK